MITSLGARVHLSVRPLARERFITLFRDVLECEVRELDLGTENPILLVWFPDSSSFSVEFSDLAPEEPASPLTYERAFRGAWIEFRTPDLQAIHERLDDAAVPSFSHPASPHRYFSAPGGQVFRVLDSEYRGP